MRSTIPQSAHEACGSCDASLILGGSNALPSINAPTDLGSGCKISRMRFDPLPGVAGSALFSSSAFLISSGVMGFRGGALPSMARITALSWGGSSDGRKRTAKFPLMPFRIASTSLMLTSGRSRRAAPKMLVRMTARVGPEIAAGASDASEVLDRFEAGKTSRRNFMRRSAENSV